ncbi:MAG: STAS domain-containing protein [Bryobacteraceae bacterium]|jgi:anti-anti-sigma factor|nr:STAS domain-containing protein [Bryobacteraceae bacterium]
MSLEIQQREYRPGVLVISLAGRVMLGPESERIEAVVEQALERGVRDFIFDLHGVTHIDSTGIGRFIASFNRVRRAGGRMHMVAAPGAVRDGFRVTRLDTVFPFYRDVESAAAALGHSE